MVQHLTAQAAMQLARVTRFAVALLAGTCLVVAGAPPPPPAPPPAPLFYVTSYVETSTALREALLDEYVDEIKVIGNIALDPVEWSSIPVLVKCGYLRYSTKFITGAPRSVVRAPARPPFVGAVVTLDFRGLVGVIQIGPGCRLLVQTVELLNHMQQDGTPDVYMGGMQVGSVLWFLGFSGGRCPWMGGGCTCPSPCPIQHACARARAHDPCGMLNR